MRVRKAPAKLNLALAITGVREDGFHDLISLATPVEGLCDEIELEVVAPPPPPTSCPLHGSSWRGVAGARYSSQSDEEQKHHSAEAEGGKVCENNPSRGAEGGNLCGGADSISCDTPGVPLDESNLVMKATALFRETFPFKASLRWNIKKHIPCGAGLGGGSSDAAAALLLLQEVAREEGVSCDEQTLLKIAERVGSDVPFFLRGKAAIMRGRGELIEELSKKEAEALREKKILIFKPAFEISTAEAYAEMRRNAPHDYMDAKDAEEKISKWRANPHGPLPLFNNMERPAFRKYLALPALFEILREKHGVEAHMSGSGSACFVEVSSSNNANEIVATLHDCLGKDAFVTLTTPL